MESTRILKSSFRRCTKCLLPDSLPGSQFDDKGECIWCQRGFPNYAPLGEDRLRDFLEQKQNRGSGADCLVAVSGGKDSTYALMSLKRQFGMRVEAFTYVHDGLTDFALKNAKNVCKSLGVTHHLLSLPNHAHLESFKDFFCAWVDSRQPLAAAMTCVACKHLHIMGTRLAKERRIPVVVWATCPLEVPPFIPTQPETGENEKSKSMVSLGMLLAKTIFRQTGFRKAFKRNPFLCIQGCLAFRPDSIWIQRRYPSVSHLHYFSFCVWNGKQIAEVLKQETPWSIPESVVSDWHSDCLFNVFKEYMFQRMLGASYTDAFLSNQIRHGMLTREEGLTELARSKEFYAAEVPKTLEILGLAHLRSRCDTSCFTESIQFRKPHEHGL